MLFLATKLRFQSPFAAATPYLVALVGLVFLYFSGRISIFLVVAMAIGGGVGAVEIMGRYRQAPLRAVLSYSGFTFVGVNVLASAGAWYLMHVMHAMGEKLPGALGDPEDVKVKAAIISGFGALVFLRSAVFKVRINETDVGVGPAALLDSLMLIADRGVDRWEAVARAREVSRLVARMKDPVSVARLLGKYSLALMQNIDLKSIEDLNETIKKIVENNDTPDSIKMDIVALRLGVVVGRDALEAAAMALNERLSASASVAAAAAPTTAAMAAEARAAIAAGPAAEPSPARAAAPAAAAHGRDSAPPAPSENVSPKSEDDAATPGVDDAKVEDQTNAANFNRDNG